MGRVKRSYYFYKAQSSLMFVIDEELGYDSGFLTGMVCLYPLHTLAL